MAILFLGFVIAMAVVVIVLAAATCLERLGFP